MEANKYEIVDGVEKLEAAIARVRAAQNQFATYTQEQVDKIFLAAASAANKQRIPLAKMAVEETGMGVVEDKVIKNHYAAEYIYNAYKNTKTCGVIEDCRADRRRCCGHPDHQPHLDRYLQDTDFAEDAQRHHHQPAPESKEVHHRGCKGRAGSRG